MNEDINKDSWSPTFDPAKLREKRTVLPTKFATPLEDEAMLPKQEVTDYSSALPVDAIPGRTNTPAREGANFDEKIYLFPESYNKLREELCNYYPNLWDIVGHAMAFDAIKFIEFMDAALDIKTTWDSAKVGAICHRYLDALRMKRGLSTMGPYTEGQVQVVL